MSDVLSRGVAIHYEVEGEGEGAPLILHTSGGGDLQMWRQAGYVDGLADQRVVLMDHRGHGRSGRPRQLGDHRIDRYVGDVLAVADALELEAFSFFGYSDGATIGYELAARHPERVAALIGLGTVGRPDELPDGRRGLAASVRAGGMVLLVEKLRAAEGRLPEWFEEQMLGTDPEMFALELEGWADGHGSWSAFERIVSPTLVHRWRAGRWSGGGSMEDAESAAGMMAKGRAVALPGLGHVAVFARSGLVLPHVRSFLGEALA